jgi:hypothetical protein
MTDLATQTWRRLLHDVLTEGKPTEQDSAGAEWRGRTSYELLAHRTTWPMAQPVVLCPIRKLGYRFLAAEAAWILSGSNLLEDIAPFAPQLVKMSDDGQFMSGAYGPPFLDQLPYVLQTLARDGASRQAVSVIWRYRPGTLKDVPCTLSLQFVIRPGVTSEPTIHTIATMRSSDSWMGIPYDVHFFAMAGAFVALHLRDRLGPLALGNVYVTSGSQHLYRLDEERARSCVTSLIYEHRISADGNFPISLGLSSSNLREDVAFDLDPLNLAEFGRPHDLVAHLWAVARRSRGDLRGGWLAETLS